MKPTKAAIKEQTETYPELYSVACPMWLAEHLAASWERTMSVMVVQSKATTVSWCSGVQGFGYRLTMRRGFTIGDLAHEMAHAVCFEDIGSDHRHAHPVFQCRMRDYCSRVTNDDLLAALDSHAQAPQVDTH